MTEGAGETDQRLSLVSDGPRVEFGGPLGKDPQGMTAGSGRTNCHPTRLEALGHPLAPGRMAMLLGDRPDDGSAPRDAESLLTHFIVVQAEPLTETVQFMAAGDAAPGPWANRPSPCSRDLREVQ